MKSMSPHQIIVRPIVTEKGHDLSQDHNQYAFQVQMRASKKDVKAAVEEIFNVRVQKVRTMVVKGKPRRRRIRRGVCPDWKKAIVTVHSDQRIDIF